MSTESEDLARVYGARSPGEIREAYEGWSARYDADNIAKGFRLPQLAAAFAARHIPADAGPVLDAACGTGLVGESLALLGYREIVGLDISPAMLAAARALGVYARLEEQDLGEPVPAADGTFAGFLCIGAFGPGHAPPAALDELARVTRAGGAGIFNLVEATAEAQGFPAKMAALAEAGRWRLRERSPAFRPYLLAEPELVCRMHVYEVL